MGKVICRKKCSPPFTCALLLALLVAAFGASAVRAQNNAPGNGGTRNRGSRDPAQYQERRLARYRDHLEIKDDAEWKAIQPLLQKVLEAQQEVRRLDYVGTSQSTWSRTGGPGSSSRSRVDRGDRGGGGNGGGAGTTGGSSQDANPEVAALQKAVNSHASAPEVKARLNGYRNLRQRKEGDFTKVQDDLRQVLTVYQEVIAVLIGLLR